MFKIIKNLLLLIGVIVCFNIVGCGSTSQPPTQPYEPTPKPKQLTIAEYKEDVKIYTEKIEGLLSEFDTTFTAAQKRMDKRTPDEKLRQPKTYHDGELSGLSIRKKADIEKLSHDLYLLEERSKAMPNLYLRSTAGSLMSMIRRIDADDIVNAKRDIDGAKSNYKEFKGNFARFDKL